LKTLERTMGISYRVAWMMLQRFRVAMVDSERRQLSGNVEVDETLIGGVQQGGKRGRGSTKSIVVIAVEIKHPKGFGRVRMRYIPDASGDSLLPFVREVVAPGSVVHTDGWRGYNELPKHGYTREITILSSAGMEDPDCRLVMCGTGVADALVKAVQSADPRILFRGLVTREEVLKLQLEATVLVNPRKTRRNLRNTAFLLRI